MVVCPEFFKLPVAPKEFHGTDQTMALIHELTNYAHTGNNKGYTLECDRILVLSNEQALKNGASGARQVLTSFYRKTYLCANEGTELWLRKLAAGRVPNRDLRDFRF